ncbi:hypothetical protein [Burkholderia seminalis]|uniref:hypothetical protein n=1 Tax=Burkholderia seminalis TaxID=488731 RepID=UPI0019031167|nr:hypothetical protein [Burkholderia seminalis]MBJ9964457.1 hypothetical protein [Burkholderia seminalis]
MDEREMFEQWYIENAFDYVANPLGSRECGLQWQAWQAGRRTTPDREAIIEECASIAERTYAKDAFRFELGTEAARAIRALKTAPTSAQLAALDRLAENERELGLDYMTAPTSDKGGA